ncbi:MAG: hypothetical protein WA988_01635, partial [Candidatus Nanopelagicales bacterium]
MSFLLTTLTDPNTVLLAEGITQFTERKGTEVQSALRVVATVAAVGFVIFAGVKSKGAFAAIASAGLVAGLFLWFVINVTKTQQMVNDEINVNGLGLVVT